MPAVGDVVELADGSVGVISEDLSGPRHSPRWRVAFEDYSTLEIDTAYISRTLAAASYSPGDSVTVWPDIGTVQSVSGSDVTVRLERAERIEGVGHIEWTPDVVVPLWRVIRDNDSRLERNWG